jgi:hypothetical protein
VREAQVVQPAALVGERVELQAHPVVAQAAPEEAAAQAAAAALLRSS